MISKKSSAPINKIFAVFSYYAQLIVILINYFRKYSLSQLAKLIFGKASQYINWLVMKPFVVFAVQKKRRSAPARRMKKQVVFVSRTPRGREAKLAFGLRSLGWEVILIYEKEPNWELSRYFDEVRQYRHESEALLAACKYSPAAYHVFSHVADDISMAFLKNKPGRIIFDTTDVMEGLVNDTLFQHLKNKQRYCVEQADGLCCRDLQLKYVERHHGFRLPEKKTYFPEYCWDSQLAARPAPGPQDEFHIVLAGSFGLEKMNQADHGYLEIARLITSQGVHFHIYPHVHWLYVPPKLYDYMFSEYIELAKATPYLHLHKSLAMDELIPVLSGYDAGISVIKSLIYGYLPKTHTMAHYNSCGSARVSDYMDAGLPVILNQELKFQFHTLKHYGLPIDGRAALLGDLKEYLQLGRSASAKKKIAMGKSAYSLAKNSSRLADFYQCLAQ